MLAVPGESHVGHIGLGARRRPRIQAILTVVALSLTFCYVVTPGRCLAAVKPATSAPSANKVTTVVVLPLHARASRRHADLGTAISLIRASTIQQSGRATVVDRGQIENVMVEKALAEVALSDKTRLAEKGQMIGADFIVAGYYDVIDAKLVIRADLIPSARSDFTKLYEKWDRNYKKIVSQGDLAGSIQVIEKFAADLCDALPEPPGETTAPPVVADLGPGKAVAVFDFVAVPTNQKTQSTAWALADMMTTDFGEVLPISVVERRQLQAILKEKKLQLAGLTHRAQALEVGKLIGADYAAMGALLGYGDTVRLDVQVLDVATGVPVTTVSVSGSYDDLLNAHRSIVGELGEKLGAGVQRLEWLKSRNVGSSVEAMTQAWRAVDMLYDGSGDISQRRKKVRSLIALALDLDPGSATVQRRAGSIAWKMRRYDEAEEHLRKAVRIDPGSSWYNRSLSRFLLKARKKPQQALPYARRGAELARDNHRPGANALLILCLLENDKLDEAEKIGRKAVRHWNKKSKLYHAYARVLEAQGKLPQAARWYEQAATFDGMNRSKWIKAREMYERVGNRAKAMEVLDRVIRSTHSHTSELLELAKYTSQIDRNRTATLCYSIMATDEQPFSSEATALLERIGMPPQEEVFTGSAFDVDKLRRQGVFAYLQPYEGFKHLKHLPYLKEYVEDVLGVPIRIAKDSRPLVGADYQRSVDRLTPSMYSDGDLCAVRTSVEAGAIVGLTSVQINSGWTGFRFGGSDPTGIVTSSPFDKFVAQHDRWERYYSRLVFPGFQPMVAKHVYTGLQTVEESKKDCLVRKCICSKWFGFHHLYKHAGLCADCRAKLQSARPNWPTGPLHRDPIAAGPREPAAAGVERKVVLFALGLTAAEARLSAVAKAVSASTGLKTEVIEQEALPNFPTDKSGWHYWDDLLRHVYERVAKTPSPPAAICVVTKANVRWDTITLNYWHMWWSDPRCAHDSVCPVIGVSLYSGKWGKWALPRRLRHMEVLSPADTERIQTPEVPQYGKLFVGAMAIAARQDHQCWTYGCPSTTWEGIGMLPRCSYWLCTSCRQALVQYYQDREPREAGQDLHQHGAAKSNAKE